ncbi:MAG: ABC transporter substrate-binding protein [Alphaproteobacteria bacterium]|nr:ABC transporter substrate-binding protein [Alphaproteobacteria bacterium]
MIRPNRRQLLAGAGALAVAPGAAAQQASALPAGPIRILIGFAAGGGTDVQGRLIAEKMRERTGRTFVIENRAGASGTVAGDALKNAAPDGNTILLAPIASAVMAKLTLPQMNHDPFEDHLPISLLGTFQLALAVSPGLGPKTVAEFVAWAKANPKQANYGTTAMGSLPHFFGVLLARGTGVDFQAVAYRGAAPLVQDLSGGQIPAGTGALTDFLEHHRGGRLRILATSGTARPPAAPELPTFSELGFRDIVGSSWLGFFAPARTPRPIIDAFNREIAAVVALPDIKDRLIQLGLEPRTTTPEEFDTLRRADAAKWKAVVDASGYKP